MEETMEQELVVYEGSSAIQQVELTRKPEEVLDEQEKIARLLVERVFRLNPPKVINKKAYPSVEHWQTVASFYGVTARITQVDYVNEGGESGYRAIAEAIKGNQILSRAEGFCGDTEDRWNGRPAHQRRAMAQTRAVSRVLRTVFSRIMILAGVSATPAEEMEDHGEDFTDTPRQAPRPYATQYQSGGEAPEGGFKKNPNKTITEKQVKLVFGRAKSKGLSGQEVEQLVQNEYGCKVPQMTMGQMDEFLERLDKVGNS